MPKKIGKCSGCDEELKPNWKFCANCGAVVIIESEANDLDQTSLKSSSIDTK